MRPLLYRTCMAPSAGRLVEELFTQLRVQLPHAGVREYSLPREHARMQSIGRQGSLLAKTLVIEFDRPGRISVILVPETLGF